MKPSHRTIATLFMVLFLFGTLFGQQRTPSSTQSSVPIVTATASIAGVDFVSVGRVHQTRLQIFSPDGAQVFDSDFQLGNLISWQLRDQQGSHLIDGAYLYLVTVRDFSERLTQKYGTAVLERERVYLEQPGRDELPQSQTSALEANRLAETLSQVDRVGVAALNRTDTPTLNTTGTTASATEASTATNTSNPTTGGESLATGTGTSNYVARWMDNAGTLGDSSLFDTNGRVGIGTSTPNANTVLHLHKSWNNGTAFLVTNSDPGSGALVTMRAGLNPNNYAVDYASLNVLSANWAPGSAGPFLKGKTVLIEGNGSNFGIGNINNTEPLIFYTTASRQERMRVTAEGNVGIGISTPSFKFDVLGNIRAANNSSNDIQVETSGGTNSWARFSMKTLNQRWVLGTSQNFNGEQFYLYDDTNSKIRMSVQPNNGAIVFPNGNVGIGATPTAAKLHVSGDAAVPAIYAESSNRGVWGWSNGGDGVYGESISGRGVTGITQSSSIIFPGVQGTSVGAGGIGVRGDGTTGVYGLSPGGVGVTGEASGSGIGVYGTSAAGYAMYANGNAGQARDKNGFVKAMIYVNPFRPPEQYLVRCYNGLTNVSTGNCGFTVTRANTGYYKINFGPGFTVSDRFLSLTLANFMRTGAAVTDVPGVPANEVNVLTYDTSRGEGEYPLDSAFYLIVY